VSVADCIGGASTASCDVSVGMRQYKLYNRLLDAALVAAFLGVSGDA
jgi:hypothetical protein